MFKVVEKEIKLINKECQSLGLHDQGIFREGSCIPTHIKEPVIYGRFNTNGMTGGGWWDDAELESYENDKPSDFPEVLGITARKYRPDITYEEMWELRTLIRNVQDSDDSDYYGNVDNYDIDYVLLSEFEQMIKKFRADDERRKTEGGSRELL